jgi:hypothetical protein
MQHMSQKGTGSQSQFIDTRANRGPGAWSAISAMPGSRRLRLVISIFALDHAILSVICDSLASESQDSKANESSIHLEQISYPAILRDRSFKVSPKESSIGFRYSDCNSSESSEPRFFQLIFPDSSVCRLSYEQMQSLGMLNNVWLRRDHDRTPFIRVFGPMQWQSPPQSQCPVDLGQEPSWREENLFRSQEAACDHLNRQFVSDKETESKVKLATEPKINASSPSLKTLNGVSRKSIKDEDLSSHGFTLESIFEDNDYSMCIEAGNLNSANTKKICDSQSVRPSNIEQQKKNPRNSNEAQNSIEQSQNAKACFVLQYKGDGPNADPLSRLGICDVVDIDDDDFSFMIPESKP